MTGIESLSHELGGSPLFEQAKSFDVLPDEQLNAPIGKEGCSCALDETKSRLHGESLLSAEELNKPISFRDNAESAGLTAEEKGGLKEDTGWSDKTLDSIRTVEEANVYKDAGLTEVNGNLERTDIDWEAKIPQDRIDRMRRMYGDEVADRWSGKTNADLIREGKAPYGPDNELVNLHHIGQKPDSPLAELTNTEHKSNDRILHIKTKESEIERPVFKAERQAYWRNRYNELKKNC